MKFKSPVYSQASGSIAGITYSHNRGGMYARARTIPTDPNSVNQQLCRQQMQNLVAAWIETLTAAQRAAWDTYAENVEMTDALGDPLYLTGQQHFIRSNLPRVPATLAMVSAGPTTYDLGEYGPISINAIEDDSDVIINFTGTDDWCDELASGLIVYASAPKNPTVNFHKGPYRLCGLIEGDNVTPPTSPQTVTSPHTYTADQHVFVMIRVCRADGRLSEPLYLGPQVVEIA